MYINVKKHDSHACSKVLEVSWLVFYGTFTTNRLYHAIEVGNVSHRAGGERKYKITKEYNKPTQS